MTSDFRDLLTELDESVDKAYARAGRHRVPFVEPYLTADDRREARDEKRAEQRAEAKRGKRAPEW